MALKAALIFLTPQVDPQKDRQTVVTPAVELTAVAVNNYVEAGRFVRSWSWKVLRHLSCASVLAILVRV